MLLTASVGACMLETVVMQHQQQCTYRIRQPDISDTQTPVPCIWLDCISTSVVMHTAAAAVAIAADAAVI